ncbi:hypothetical protein MPDQ_002053 [Monascus purpureus]|uniref:Acyltransferase 3 domain-containing protein n=1 Tax=Monascus purpureus TaxID=5098 RepID=A0A507R4H3_MONPU|nr:hypothetical protein MPDQ_002053 [Monascus purpureus]BDD56285.1 hypothetical protein MAP00_001758 [Monascus purpureus]
MNPFRMKRMGALYASLRASIMKSKIADSLELNGCTPTLLYDLERQDLNLSPEALPSSPNTTGNGNPTAFLDGLRGIAAVFVFIQHFIGSYDYNVHEHGFGENGNYYIASMPFVRILFSGGSAAVAIFFVLSGYVLSKSPIRLLRQGKRSECARSLVSATIRRPFRLYLPTLAVTLLVALLMHAPFGIMREQPWPQPRETLWDELVTWLCDSAAFFNPFRRHSNLVWFRYSMVAWTIPVELVGSWFVYLLMAILAFSGLWLSLSLCLLSITAILLLHNGQWDLACFTAGLILAHFDVYSLDIAYLAQHLTRRPRLIFWNVTFVVGYYLLCEPAHNGHVEYSLDTPGWHYLTLLIPSCYDQDRYYRFWHSWGAFLLVYAILRLHWLRAIFNTKPMQYVGKVSFMLYLIHLPMFAIVGDRIGKMLGQDNLAAEPWWENRLYIPDIGPTAMSTRFLLCLSLVLSICLAVADLGRKLFDVPSVRAGKWISQKLGVP